MAILKELRIGNAETERMIRTIKEEVIWTHEFDSLQEAKRKSYPHSAIGYRFPSMSFKEWMGKEGSKKVA